LDVVGEVGGGEDPGVLDGYAGVLKRVPPTLGGDRVGLAGEGLPSVEVAVLEDDGGVAEDEVDGAVDDAGFEELALCLDEESVLEAFEGAGIEDGEIGCRPESHRLAFFLTRRVAERDSACDESKAIYS